LYRKNITILFRCFFASDQDVVARKTILRPFFNYSKHIQLFNLNYQIIQIKGYTTLKETLQVFSFTNKPTLRGKGNRCNMEVFISCLFNRT